MNFLFEGADHEQRDGANVLAPRKHTVLVVIVHVKQGWKILWNIIRTEDKQI